MGIFSRFAFALVLAALLSSPSYAETTCSVNGCDITITIKMAFAGANDSYINNAKNEIDDFWNGPRGFRTAGECKCTVEVKVETKKVADCSVNPPAGYHCITVTPFFKPDGSYDNPPRNQTNITGAEIYVAYVNGIARGNGSNSQGGWFSDLTSRPVSSANPAGPHYMDFAHEAGHLMGLPHNNNTSSIMNNTLATEPSQGDLNGIVEAICGQGACPDSCCCGNGVVESGKGETCDPKAAPTGCAAGASCCPVCCSCYSPLCVAANGEYLSQSSCQSACGSGSSCYKNYKTGCWDCLKQTVVISGTCRDPQNIRGNPACDHVSSFMGGGMGFYKSSIFDVPVLGGALSDERINIRTAEGDSGFIISRNGAVESYGLSLLEDPTVQVETDRETIRLIAGEEMGIQQAMSSGRIRIMGVGFFEGIRFWTYGALFGAYDFFYPAEEFKMPPGEPDYPDEYAPIAPQEPPVQEPSGVGGLPDLPYAHG